MTDLSFTWSLRDVGWAVGTIADGHGQAEAIASYVTGGPEYLLRAVASLASGAADTRAEFEAEGQVFRWFFHRDGTYVDIRLAEAPDTRSPDTGSSVIWSGRHSVPALAVTIVGAFDRALSELGDEAYQAQWGRAFPHADVEALRATQLAGEQ